MNTMSIAVELLTAARIDGGVTLDPIHGTRPTSGYVVGVPGRGISFRDAPGDYVDIGTISTIVNDIAASVYHVGSWKNGNTVYIDAVEILHDRKEAIAAGRARGELAIYNLGTGEEIFVLEQQ